MTHPAAWGHILILLPIEFSLENFFSPLYGLCLKASGSSSSLSSLSESLKLAGVGEGGGREKALLMAALHVYAANCRQFKFSGGRNAHSSPNTNLYLRHVAP